MSLTPEELRKDHYKILGVSENATKSEIKRAYRKLAKEKHPDGFEDGSPEQKRAAEEFKEINVANEILSDPQKRAEYDKNRVRNASNSKTSQQNKQNSQQRTQSSQQRTQNRQQSNSQTNNSRTGTQRNPQNGYKHQQKQEWGSPRTETPHKKESSKPWGIFLLIVLFIGFFGYRYITMGKVVINMPSGTVVVFENDGRSIAKRESLPCEISLKEGIHKIKIIAGNKYWVGDVKVTARQEVKPARNIKVWQTLSKISAKAKVNRKRTTKKLQKNAIKTQQTTQDEVTVTPQQINPNQENIVQQEIEAARKKREENLRRIQEAEQQ